MWSHLGMIYLDRSSDLPFVWRFAQRVDTPKCASCTMTSHCFGMPSILLSQLALQSRIGTRVDRHRWYGDFSNTMTDSQEARLLQALQPKAAAWIIATLSKLEAQLAVLTSQTASLKQQLRQQRRRPSSVRQL